MRQPVCRPTLAWFLVLSAPAAAQTTWYVDAAGTLPGAGTPSEPYASIDYAIHHPATQDGDVFLVAPGTYSAFSVAWAPRVTIESQGGPEYTSILGEIYLSGSTLRGFHISNPGGTAVKRGHAEKCVITDSAVGFYGGPADYAVSCTVVGCDLGIEDQEAYGGVWIWDTILYGNVIDMYSGDWFCSLWETWDKKFGGVYTQSYDPGFWDFAGGDYRLRADSPAIGAGCVGEDLGAFPYDSTYLPTPDTFCTAKVTSNGCQPAIGWSATSNSASFTAAEPFVITAAGAVQGKPGHFYFGLSAMTPLPYQGSWLCVLPPTARTANQLSSSSGVSCSGSFAFDFNAHVQSGATPFLVPGVGIYGQFWYRDPLDPSGSGRTDAIAFALNP